MRANETGTRTRKVTMIATRTGRENGKRTTQDLRHRLIGGLPVSERFIDVRGARTSVLEGGSGAPLLLLHGPGGFGGRWMRVIPDLVADYRVIAPDLPGHGASEAPADELDAAWVIDWLDTLIERTADEPPVIVGHNLGGSIAARFAIAHPERLRRLVLVDSFGLAPFRPSPRFALALIAMLAVPGKRSYQHFMGQCEYDRDGLAEDMGGSWPLLRDYLIDRARDPGSRSAMRSLMSNVGVPPIPPGQLDRIRVPVSLIWGRHDRALHLSIAESASERYGWPLQVIEDTADDAPLEQPAAFIDALRNAMDEKLTVSEDSGTTGGGI
jgi:pimeloyl-ACP methyl ester carboxylesterase